MKIPLPKIFAWPTPWLWGAIAVLIVVNNHKMVAIISALCGIVIAASVVHMIRSVIVGRREQDTPKKIVLDDQNGRLEDIERRLTDTQDVMIALSEKLDRWEEERSKI